MPPVWAPGRWSRLCGAQRSARGQLAALVALELGLALQAAIALAGLALGSEPREPATSLGYLAASVLILPAVIPSARSRSRWDAGVIALVCLALAVVSVRLRTTWGRALTAPGGCSSPSTACSRSRPVRARRSSSRAR